MRLSRRIWWAVGVLAVATGCGDSPSEPRAGAPASLVIEGNPALLGVGDSARLSARVVDSAGRHVPPTAVTWASLDTSVARVDGAGTVHAWDGGLARVVARVGDAADTAWLRVEVMPRSVELEVFRCCLTDPAPPLTVGSGIWLRAVVRDGRDRELATPTFTYASSDTTVASRPTTNAGSIYAFSVARRAGPVTLSATLGDLRVERTVQVVASASTDVFGGAR
jgi:uncharacterized protein YjdB